MSEPAVSPARNSQRQAQTQGDEVATPERDFPSWLKQRQEQWSSLRSERSDADESDQQLVQEIQRVLEQASGSSQKNSERQRHALEIDTPGTLTAAQLLALLPALKESVSTSASTTLRYNEYRNADAVPASSRFGNSDNMLVETLPQRRHQLLQQFSAEADLTTRVPMGNIKSLGSEDAAIGFQSGAAEDSPNVKPKTRFLFKNTPLAAWVKQLTLVEHGPDQGRLSVAYLYLGVQPPAVITNPSEAEQFLSDLSMSKELMSIFDFRPVFCICHQPEDTKRYAECAVGRGGCSGWMHMECVGLKSTLPDHVLEPMACPLCTNYAIGTGNQQWLSDKNILSATISRDRIYGNLTDLELERLNKLLAADRSSEHSTSSSSASEKQTIDSADTASLTARVMHTGTMTHDLASTSNDDSDRERTVVVRGPAISESKHAHAEDAASRTDVQVRHLATVSSDNQSRQPTTKPGGFAISSNLLSQLRRDGALTSKALQSQPLAQASAPAPATVPNPTQPLEVTVIDGLEIQSSYLPHFQYGIERSQEAWPRFATIQRCQDAMYSWTQACKALYTRTCEHSYNDVEDERRSAPQKPQKQQQQQSRQSNQVTPRAATPSQLASRPRDVPTQQQQPYVSPYAGFLIPALTLEEEEAASQLLGICADAALPDGRTRKVFVQGGWMFSAAARRNMELAEARRQNSKTVSSLFNKHSAELFKIAVRCAGSNKERRKGAKWVGPSFASLPAEDGGLRTICVGASREVRSLREYCDQQNRCMVCLAPLSRAAGAIVAKQSKRRLDFATGRIVEDVYMDAAGRILTDSAEQHQAKKRSKRESSSSDRQHALVHTKCKYKVLRMLAEATRTDDDAPDHESKDGDDEDAAPHSSKRRLSEQDLLASSQVKHCSLCSLEDGLLLPFRRQERAFEWAHPMCIMWFQNNIQQGSHGHVASNEDTDQEIVHSREFEPASAADGCPTPSHIQNFGRCAMCGNQDGDTIRCAMYGCYVRMHPLCGLVESCYSGVARPNRPDVHGRMLSVPFLLCPYHSTAVQTA